MEPNPYESPVIPTDKQAPDEPGSAIALLAEMRDMQREMLTLTRSNTAMNRYAIITVLGLAVVGGICIAILTGVMALKFALP